jgi:uncharacterized protein YjhX (UPF0386 family)
MEKKISTKKEQAVDWLRSEIEKDKIELEREKQKMVNSIKELNKEDIIKPTPKLTIWQKIKKPLLP